VTNATELPVSVERRRRLVKRCGDSGNGTAVWAGDGGRTFVDARIDLVAARRVAGAFRRVDRAEIVLNEAGSGDAVVDAVGHRLPVRRKIAVGAALGLARLGVPTVVETVMWEEV